MPSLSLPPTLRTERDRRSSPRAPRDKGRSEVEFSPFPSARSPQSASPSRSSISSATNSDGGGVTFVFLQFVVLRCSHVGALSLCERRSRSPLARVIRDAGRGWPCEKLLPSCLHYRRLRRGHVDNQHHQR